MSDLSPADRLARIEQVLHRILQTLQVHTEKMDAILEAATAESGPSETQKLLGQIVHALEEQKETMETLPAVLGEVIRDELYRADAGDAGDADALEPAVPGAFGVSQTGPDLHSEP